MSECTCYLGHPDDPAADEEACASCDAEFWANPVYRLPDEVIQPDEVIAPFVAPWVWGRSIAGGPR